MREVLLRSGLAAAARLRRSQGKVTREFGDILLLSTYELGHQPMGLAMPAAFLERAGFRPRAIDLAVEPLDEEAARRARLVAISVPMHTALRLGVRVADRVRALNPSAHICFHGLYAPLFRDHLLSSHAQSVLGGECEAELVALVEGLSPRAVVLERLNFVAPQRSRLPPLAKYAKLVVDGEERLAGYVEASRGCKHLCRHCPIPSVYDGRFFVIPESIVVEDVAHQVAAGARHLTFGDPDFLNGPNHALAVARAVHAAFPSLTFDVTVKIEHILKHREVWPELRALGCLFVVSAVESLSPRVLEILDKGHSAADVDEALTLLRAAGLVLHPSFVPFSPWETRAGYLALLDWIESRALVDVVDPVQLAIRLLIPPGSKLLALDEVRRLVGPLVASRLSYGWEHPDPSMDELQRAVYALVEHSEDRVSTFARIRALARGETVPPPSPPSSRTGPPHLTESWFC